MNETLKSTMDMVRTIKFSSRVKHHRNVADFLADRIVQAATQQTLLAAVERLCELMDADPGEMLSSVTAEFLKSVSKGDASGVLAWLRKYSRIAAMLTMLKQDDYLETVVSLEITDIQDDGSAIPDVPHDIGVKITCLSPLAHGADIKAGNASLYRRMDVLSTTGGMLRLPFYAGNAFRGQMRDILADDLVKSLGLLPRRDKPPLSLWFFQALYAGGSLEENSAAEKALRKSLGANGSVRAKGVHEFRDILPGLSLLGTALGNRVLCGRSRFSDFRPECRQWGNGETEVGELFEWLYLTRREDHEEYEENHSMIANTECLKAGSILRGGIDMDGISTELERSALGRGLQLLAETGYIGAENRRGLGRCRIECVNAPDPSPYREYLETNRSSILEYLSGMGAINACD